jgi:hypothetical protein
MIEHALWMLIIMAFTAIFGILILRNKPGRLWFVAIAELALICRFIFVFVIYANGTEYSGTDGLLYHQIAKDIAVQLQSGTPLWKVRYEYTWYTVLTGIQYAVFGVNRYAASFVNAFISVLSGYFLTGIALNLGFSLKKSRLIGLAYLFIPSMIVWTTDTRKESIVFFLIILIWYMTLRVIRQKDWHIFRQCLYILVICLLLWLSTLLRIYMLYTFGGGLFVCLLLCFLKTKRKMIFLFLSAVLITCCFVSFTTVRRNMNDYHALTINRSEGGDENLDEEIDSIIKTIMSKNIPSSINGFLTKPHLEEVPFIPDIAGNPLAITVVRIEMILWYICMIISVFGIMYAMIKWDPYLLGLLAFIVSYGLINALISENVADTYYRYRAAIVAPLLLFADYKPFFDKIKSLLLTGTPVDKTEDNSAMP